MTVSPAFKKSMPVQLFAEYTHHAFDVIDNSNESSVDVKSLMERFTLDVRLIKLMQYTHPYMYI